jgi:hypothetical protein
MGVSHPDEATATVTSEAFGSYPHYGDVDGRSNGWLFPHSAAEEAGHQPRFIDGSEWCPTEAAYMAGLAAWSRSVFPAGGQRVCWPKKTARKKPEFAHVDITEDTIREHGLLLGLLDNKVCAVNDDWSGLRLVWRVELRDRG